VLVWLLVEVEVVEWLVRLNRFLSRLMISTEPIYQLTF
jgi:hypothetical protein